ncbi:50S ribosomal protein L24 [Demequina flava]|uniref:50S ribosomal protein L24 n=1 Tax=Demequina flava TaxID=1095025 RepID=UPI0007835496|nr:50S ribosomal protein L24 [Demequina flava]
MAKIKKGDLVVVIAGRDRGQQGRVLEIDKERDRVLVEGVHRVTKHIKPGTSRDNQSGGIVEVEAAMHISNVMLVDPETKKGTRVGYRTAEVEQDGRTRTKRVRVAKRSGKDVE